MRHFSNCLMDVNLDVLLHLFHLFTNLNYRALQLVRLELSCLHKWLVLLFVHILAELVVKSHNIMPSGLHAKVHIKVVDDAGEAINLCLHFLADLLHSSHRWYHLIIQIFELRIESEEFRLLL